MLKFTITLFIAFILNVNPNHAHPRFSGGDNDSLLFDGEEEYTEIPYKPADDQCQVVVVDAPCARGDIYVTKIGSVCGVKDTIIREKKDQVLKNGDILVPGSIIRTCPADLPDKKNAVENTVVAVVLTSGGKPVPLNVELAPNTDFIIFDPSVTCNALKNKKFEPVKVKLNKGKMYSNISDDIRASLIVVGEQAEQFGQVMGLTVVGAFNSIIDHINTKFSVEINTDGTDTVDIIRVYEGSATVKLAKSPPSNKNENKEQIDQLQKDYKDGKLTAQEFGDKMKELSQNMTKKALDIVPVEVTAGNKCTATNHSLTVEPIETDDVQWWNK
ncbi:MAG: hypothetical protein ACHQJ4_01505 [Ignavibacteria bacterium]